MFAGHFCPPGSGYGSKEPIESGSTTLLTYFVSHSKAIVCVYRAGCCSSLLCWLGPGGPSSSTSSPAGRRRYSWLSFPYRSVPVSFYSVGSCLLPRQQCFSPDTSFWRPKVEKLKGVRKKCKKNCVNKISVYFLKLQEEPSAIRRKHQLLKTCIFFIVLLLRFLAFWDPDPDSDTDPVSKSIFLTQRPSWIRIRNVASFIEWPLRFSEATSSN